MDTLPDVLVAAVLSSLTLDERVRCCILSRRFARLVRDAAHTRSLDFGGVPRARRCAVDGAALGALCGRHAATLACVDLSALPLPPRGALSPAAAVAALQRCAPPGALREARAWHAGASDGVQYDVAHELCEAACAARTPEPLVALLRGHVGNGQGVISFAHGLMRVLRAAEAADEEAGVHPSEAGADAADVAADAGAAAALLAALAVHADGGQVAYECLGAFNALARLNPNNVPDGAPRAAAATARRWLPVWHDDGDSDAAVVALRALALFEAVPAPEALRAAVAVLQCAPSDEVTNAALMFVSEQRAGADAHAADAPALGAVLRVAAAAATECVQNRLLALSVLLELLEARRAGARRGARVGAARAMPPPPPPPPHPEAPRLLAAAVAALRQRAKEEEEEERVTCVFLYAAAVQLLRHLLMFEGVSVAQALDEGALLAAISALRAFGDVTDTSAPVWCRLLALLCDLAGAQDDAAERADDAAASVAASHGGAAAAVAAGVHEAARAVAAARPADEDVQRAACAALLLLAVRVTDDEVTRPGGLLEIALAAHRSLPFECATDEYGEELGEESVAMAAVQRLAQRSVACRARLHELCGVKLEQGPNGWERLVQTAPPPPPPPPPRRDTRVAESVSCALACVPASVQLHFARAGAASALRHCVAQAQELDPSAAASPQRARRSEAHAAAAAVLAVAAHVEAGRPFHPATSDEDHDDDAEDDALLEAAKAAALAAAGASRGAEALAAWSSALVTLALLGELAIVEAEAQGPGVALA
jgi:hypothetical protein